MPAPPATAATVSDHPGSTYDEIAREPNWGSKHQHRIGFINRSGRIAGLTHDGDYPTRFEDRNEDERAFVEEAQRKHRELRAREQRGDLVNFKDVMHGQTVGSIHVAKPGKQDIYADTCTTARITTSIDQRCIHQAGALLFARRRMRSSKTRIGLVKTPVVGAGKHAVYH
jgi:hypothetical protein